MSKFGDYELRRLVECSIKVTAALTLETPSRITFFKNTTMKKVRRVTRMTQVHTAASPDSRMKENQTIKLSAHL